MTQAGFLLVGHGSSKPYNKELVMKTADLISQNHPEYIVRSAFMWKNSPTIPESLDTFKTEDIDSLVVVPLFLERGIHIDDDIPRQLNLQGGQKKGTYKLTSREIPLFYGDPIGPDPVLAELMLENTRRALAII